jgi:capsular polysaccharide biosynthesis protein
MNEIQNVVKSEDEIDLKELFMVLWKGKRIIIIVTLIFAILSALVTMFLIPPVYEAKLDLLVNFPETVSTKYGDYKLLLTTNDQYINLFYSNNVLSKTIQDMNYDANKNTIESFTKRISIIKDDKRPNSFTIKVKANNPKEALDLANKLYKNYVLFVTSTNKLRSIEHFIELHAVDLSKNNDTLKSSKVLLERNKKMLESMSQTINQKTMMDSINSSTINYMVLDNLINQNYKKVELDIINIEQTIYTVEDKINIANQYLNELSELKDGITNNNELTNDYLTTINRSVQLPSAPVAPTAKTGPSTSLNTVIAALIGGMISVIYVLIKKYWFNDEKIKIK